MIKKYVWLLWALWLPWCLASCSKDDDPVGGGQVENSSKTFQDENKYARKWQDDTRMRVNVSLYGSLAWNALYGIRQLWLGFYHQTFWFYSLGAYYI